MRVHVLAILPSIALLALAGPTFATAQESAPKLYFDACPGFSEVRAFDCYRNYEEVTRFLEEAARGHPDRAELSSMGRSWEGRELWVLTITDPATGAPEDKPALWVDGGIDADEVVATEAALGLVHRLLTSDDPRVRELLATRTFYVAPQVIPDATERHHSTPVRPRDTTLRPWDDDGDGAFDEDGPDDLDGDGQALQMRQVNPLGEWVEDEEDPRLMRRRRAGDAGPFYHVYPEGLDDDEDGRYGEDPFGGVDPNRNYPGNWNVDQGGSGPFPGSELELRAMLDFAVAHPNIAASQHFHSSGGVILRPPSVPDLELPEADLSLYMDVAREGLEVTGYDLATSVYDWNWPRGSSNRKTSQVWRDSEGRVTSPRLEGDAYGPASGRDDLHPLDGSGTTYPAYGGSIDGFYLLLGVLAFANEIYAMGEDDDGDGRIEAHEQLRYNDEEMDGYAFREWTPFTHPQLGPVEIGGWRKFGHNNPPPSELPEEVRRNVDFALLQAESMPLLAVEDVSAESLGDGVYRVTASVENHGLQPTELAMRRQQGRAVPVRVTVEGGEVLDEEAVREVEVLEGFGREEVSWVVRSGNSGSFTVRAWHPKGGRASANGRF